MSRLRLPMVVIVGFVLAVLLALAAFTSAEAAEQKDAGAKEPTDAAATEETDAATTEGTVPEATEGPITSENHSWGGYHWARTSNPFTLKLGDNLSSLWKPILTTTESDWTKSEVLDTTVVAGQSSAKRCAATTGRVEVCNAKYGFNGWLGIASIWILDGEHITKGTTK